MQHSDSQTLSHDQQGLLLAALNSQAPATANSGPQRKSDSLHSIPRQSSAMDNARLYMSPHQADLQANPGDYTPDLDYLDPNGLDFDDTDLGGDLIGALPGDGNGYEHEKRKHSDGDIGDEGVSKRQETLDGEKTGKKPGRKPLTNEPTTKRKAQNRAAQRAFRDRKEKHLKDLEIKVDELTKASEEDRQEKSLLQAQVDRLNSELKSYRKRLSLHSGSASNWRQPYGASITGNSAPAVGGNDFNFDFPTFDNGFAGITHPKQESLTPPSAFGTPAYSHPSANASSSGPGSRHDSSARSASPRNGQSSCGSGQGSPYADRSSSESHAQNSGGMKNATQPNMGSRDPFGDLFSPSILQTANAHVNNDYFGATRQRNEPAMPRNPGDPNGGDSTAGLNRVFQFNSQGSISDSASPSNSSSHGHVLANSSCGTSPEPVHGSPAHKRNGFADLSGITNSSPNNFQGQGQNTQASMNNNNNNNNNANNTTNSNANTATTPDAFSSNLNSFSPSIDTFDPVLFNNYRDPQSNLLGADDGVDYNGGFFDDALTQPFDYGSPSNLFGILQSPQPLNASLEPIDNTAKTNATAPSQNLMAKMDRACDEGDDLIQQPPQSQSQSSQTQPSSSQPKVVTCNNIWSQLQANPAFQNGTFDLDSLCSELKQKARCSESGVVVDQEHVEAAFQKLTRSASEKNGAVAAAGAVGPVGSGSGDASESAQMPPQSLYEKGDWEGWMEKMRSG